MHFPYLPHRIRWSALKWRHNGRDGVSNHQPHYCLPSLLFKAQIKENIKAPRHWLLWGEFTGHRTKGQKRGKGFHFMTSSCCWEIYESSFLLFDILNNAFSQYSLTITSKRIVVYHRFSSMCSRRPCDIYSHFQRRKYQNESCEWFKVNITIMWTLEELCNTNDNLKNQTNGTEIIKPQDKIHVLIKPQPHNTYLKT